MASKMTKAQFEKPKQSVQVRYAPMEQNVVQDGGIPVPPLETALSTLKNEISGVHAAVDNLFSTLEPFLPRHLFDDHPLKDEAMEKPDAGYSEYNANLSSTVLEVHKALNEVLRLQQRLNFINSMIVR